MVADLARLAFSGFDPSTGHMDTHEPPVEFDITIKKVAAEDHSGPDAGMWHVETAEGRIVWPGVTLGDALDELADAVVADDPDWAVDIEQLENPPSISVI